MYQERERFNCGHFMRLSESDLNTQITLEYTKQVRECAWENWTAFIHKWPFGAFHKYNIAADKFCDCVIYTNTIDFNSVLSFSNCLLADENYGVR